MSSCKILRTGAIMQSFSTKAAARRSAKRKKKKHRKLVPYKCTYCSNWHLRTRKNDANYKKCKCRGHGGKLKRLYSELTNAEFTRDNIRKMRGKEVYLYECPHGPGWHLTGNKRECKEEDDN